MADNECSMNINMNEALRGKRLLILGGAVQTLKVVLSAKDMGVYTIVADIEENTETKRAADETLAVSLLDSDALISWCEKHPVDGVLNFNNDFAQHSHQRICEHFGFPCYGNKEQYKLLTDKAAFKLFCKENGVGTIEGYEESCLDDNCYPVLVKPAESSGTRGSRVCWNRKELDDAIVYARKYTRNKNVLFEPYMSGKPDFEVLYYVHKGEPYMLYMGDRYLGDKEDGFDRTCVCFAAPSEYTDYYLSSTHERVSSMIRNIGLEEAPVFLQFFYDNGGFRFYDMAIRFPGDEFISILKKATGLDFVKEMIMFALTGETEVNEERLSYTYRMNGYSGALIMPAVRAGVIGSFKGMELIKKLPSTVSALQKKHIGDIVEKTGDVRQRACDIALMVQGDAEKLKETILETEQLLSIDDQYGDSMIISRPKKIISDSWNSI